MNTPAARTSKSSLRKSGIRRMIIKLSRKLSITLTWRPRARVSRLLAMLLAAASAPALALPTGGLVVSGKVNEARSDTSLTVTQATDKAIVNRTGYGIEYGESVTYVQPGTSSVILERVTGGDASRIFGQLSANGQVFLINPNGVLFAPGARVDVGGLVASTLGISDGDFMAGRYTFQNDGSAKSVVNQGSLTGKYVALVAPNVTNGGSIAANGGTVALAAGDRVSLDISGDGLLNVSVDAAAAGASVNHSGTIVADGGKVFLSAKSADALLDTVLNVSGLVRARSLSEQNGVIRLDGGSAGVVSVSGTLDASGKGGKGGTVSVLGDKVGLFNEARIDASGDTGGGTVLVGGNYQGKGPEQNASMTYVASGARIDASATGNGNGGKVVIWSDIATRYYGSIAARGGAQGGNGGFAEVSGKQNLTYAGSADMGAAKGRTGSVLLDPNDLYVGANPGGGAIEDTTNPFEAMTNPNDYYVLASNLAGDANYTLQANHDVIFNADVAFGSVGGHSVSVIATNNIQSTGWSVTTAGGTLTFNSVAMALGAINTNGGLLTINNSGAATQSGVIAGAGGLTKTGSGTLTLSQANTYTGTTTVSNGTLVATNASALGTTAAGTTVAAGATLEISGVDIGAEALTLNGTGVGGIGALVGTGTASASGAVTLDADATIGGTGNLTLSGAIGQSGGPAKDLTKVGTGKLTLSGTNTYTGLTDIQAGTLVAGSNAALGTTAGDTQVAAGATLEVSSGVAIAAGESVDLNGGTLLGTGTASLAGDITLGASSTVAANPGATFTLSGDISGANAAWSLNKTGSGTVVLSGNNVYQGNTEINAGTLVAASVNALGALTRGTNVNSGGTLVIQNVTVLEGILVNAGGTLALTGAATIAPTLTLNGTLNYSGYGSAPTFSLGGTATGLTGGWTTTGTPTVIASGGTIAGTGQTYSLSDSTADAGSSGAVSWTGFKNINDATGTVNFNTGGHLTGDVTAATLNLSAYGSPVTLDVTADSVTGVDGTLTGVGTVNANSSNANTVAGAGATYSLTNATPNAGSSGGYSWTAFRHINDATGTVDFNVSGSVTGNVTAGTLDYSAYTQDLTLNVTAGTITNGGVGGTIAADTVQGNAGQNNTVTGTGATYSLTNATPDAGSGGGYGWTAFKNISDATGTVNFNTSGSVTGNLTARTLNYGSYGQNLTLDVETGALTNDGVTGTLSGFNTVQANAARTNTVTSSGGAAKTYLLTDATPDAGSGNGYTWTAFKNINDATGTVNFNASGSVTGNVTAATLNYGGYATPVTFDLNGGASTGLATWSGVTAVTGSATQSDTITGTNQTYNLSAANAGNNGTVAWTSFENLSLRGSSTVTGAAGSSLSGALADTGASPSTALSGTINAQSVNLLGAVTLGADTAVVTANDAAFGSTINGAHALSVTSTAGNVLMGDTVGTTGTPLTSMTIDTSGAMVLPTVYAGALNVVAHGNVSQAGSTKLVVSGASAVNAGTGDVTLTQAANDFGSIGVTGQGVTLRDTNAIVLAASTVAGDLDVTSNGAMTQSGVQAVTGTTTLDAGAGYIELNSLSNQFAGALTATATATGPSSYSVVVGNGPDIKLNTIVAPSVALGTNGNIINAHYPSITGNLNVANKVYLYAPHGEIGGAAVSAIGTGGAAVPGAGIKFITVPDTSLQVTHLGNAALTVAVQGDLSTIPTRSFSNLNKAWECYPGGCTNLGTGESVVAAASNLGGILNAAAQDLFNATFGTENIRVNIQNGFLTQFGVVPPGIDAIAGDGVKVPATALVLVTEPLPALVDEEELRKRRGGK